MIAIVDYGLGNVRAFSNVYKRLDIPHYLADSTNSLERAEKIILPGVGAFDYAITMLEKSGMRKPLDYLVLDKKIPVLGICVGMQILADSSEEGDLEGLGWIPGKVKKFSDNKNSGHDIYQLPLPHMGWNSVEVAQEDPLLENLGVEARFYFLHSYYFDCADETSSLANADYGKKFSCVVKRDNIYGVQFHPEKSHHSGIRLLRNFAFLC